MTPQITRFAPSPTGRLHLGHAASAWFAFERARESGGSFLLRIEDIDASRCRPEWTAGIFEDLAWTGLTWPEPVRHQSEHLDDYTAALNRLEAMNLLYPCFCTRKEIDAEIRRAGAAPHGVEGPVYPGTCRGLTRAQREARRAGAREPALRLDLGRALERTGALEWDDVRAGVQAARPDLFGDVVLARKDIGTSYHLAVTVDDALQGVTLVTRGEDLFVATHVHRVLQALLDLPVPRYHHHPLLMDASGKRFAKRDQSQTLQALRDAGENPESIRRQVCGLEEG